MTTATSASRQTLVRAPFTLVVVAALAFMGGVGTSAVLRAGDSLAAQGRSIPAAAQSTFDPVQFRAEERAGSYPEPSFDAVKFRAEEDGR